jgi:hypothetical protein
VTGRGWWRENRVWLPGVPLALAALLAASSYNVREHWYDRGLRHELAVASPGEQVEVTDDYDDALGPTSRTFSVRLDRVREAATYPFDLGDGPPPPGTHVVEAVLDWAAEPDQVLSGCTVAVVDSDGRRYERVDSFTQGNMCVPFGHEGPSAPGLEGDVRGTVEPGTARPPTWTTRSSFVVPDGVRVTRVLVWWERPDYVALPVP